MASDQPAGTGPNPEAVRRLVEALRYFIELAEYQLPAEPQPRAPTGDEGAAVEMPPAVAFHRGDPEILKTCFLVAAMELEDAHAALRPSGRVFAAWFWDETQQTFLAGWEWAGRVAVEVMLRLGFRGVEVDGPDGGPPEGRLVWPEGADYPLSMAAIWPRELDALRRALRLIEMHANGGVPRFGQAVRAQAEAAKEQARTVGERLARLVVERFEAGATSVTIEDLRTVVGSRATTNPRQYATMATKALAAMGRGKRIRFDKDAKCFRWERGGDETTDGA